VRKESQTIFCGKIKSCGKLSCGKRSCGQRSCGVETLRTEKLTEQCHGSRTGFAFHFDADLDPTIHLDADPEIFFIQIRILIRVIRIRKIGLYVDLKGLFVSLLNSRMSIRGTFY
jgi:hypothetical protein